MKSSLTHASATCYCFCLGEPPKVTDDGWQPCDGETFAGAASSRLTIPSVQKSTEGSYRCVVSNCAGNQTSNPAPAELSVGKNQTVNAECKVCPS